jgi:hypothetical protein
VGDHVRPPGERAEELITAGGRAALGAHDRVPAGTAPLPWDCWCAAGPVSGGLAFPSPAPSEPLFAPHDGMEYSVRGRVMNEKPFGSIGLGVLTTYQMVLAAILLALFATWAVGAFLGSQKVERASLRGLAVLVIGAGLAWVFLGIPAIPQGIIRAVTGRLNLSW